MRYGGTHRPRPYSTGQRHRAGEEAQGAQRPGYCSSDNQGQRSSSFRSIRADSESCDVVFEATGAHSFELPVPEFLFVESCLALAWQTPHKLSNCTVNNMFCFRCVRPAHTRMPACEQACDLEAQIQEQSVAELAGLTSLDADLKTGAKVITASGLCNKCVL